MDARHRAEAQVDGASLRHDLNAAVLRHAPLRDIEVGHDLEAGNHRRVHIRAQRQHLVKHAVDAETDRRSVAGGLDVDVARAVAHGALDQAVDEVDDRAPRRHVVDRAEIGRAPLDQLQIGRQVFHQLGGELVAAVGVELALGDFFEPRQHQPQLAARELLNLVQNRNRERIGGRQGERVVHLEHRQDLQPAGGFLGQQGHGRRFVQAEAERDAGNAHLEAQGSEQVGLGQAGICDQPLAQALVGAGLRPHRFGQLFLGDEVHLDGNFAEPLSLLRHQACAEGVHGIRSERRCGTGIDDAVRDEDILQEERRIGELQLSAAGAQPGVGLQDDLDAPAVHQGDAIQIQDQVSPVGGDGGVDGFGQCRLDRLLRKGAGRGEIANAPEAAVCDRLCHVRMVLRFSAG